MPHRVLIPRGRALEMYLRLRSYERARRLLGTLSTDPRPSWARQIAGGWRIDLTGGEWLLYRIDDEHEQVTVILCHAA